ncbi:MAG TPA: stage V sporulation protein AD, partial [bacterium]|nr:stage V sporulation protein AD [bacterium]
MKQKKVGKQTYVFSRPLTILGLATVVGKKEGEGPLGQHFDEIISDP